jgi:hypothetical protein
LHVVVVVVAVVVVVVVVRISSTLLASNGFQFSSLTCLNDDSTRLLF